MALTKELLKVLDNKDEPLPKRLKIADNAFKSVELPIQHREGILLKWLGRVTKANETDLWNLLLSWLTSQQMQDISRNNISQEDVNSLINLIIKRSKQLNSSNSTTVLSCITALIENRNFQQFFKYDLEMYCKFISNILLKIENEDQLCNFIKNEQLFNRNLISSEEFYGYFIENTLVSLADVTEKFCDNSLIFQEISKLIERCLFHRNFKNYFTFLKLLFDEDVDLNEKPPQLPNLLFKKLQSIYDEDKKYVYKLILHSYCSAYSNNFEMVYKFFVLIVETLGFDLAGYFDLNEIKTYENSTSSVDKSIVILTALCQVLTKNGNELSLKIKDKTFTEFLQNLTVSIITLTSQPNESVYEYLACVITLNPLIIEKIISDILVYLMLSNKKNTKTQYEKFLISLFEVFAKLHRIPNLISKMIPTLKAALEGNFKAMPSTLNFCGSHKDFAEPLNHVITDVMPNEVLSYFTQCITTLASWQVMNLFKTLLFHLEAAVSTVGAKSVYIEIISTLICQFLSSVRIAEHTVPTVVVEKFVKAMDELKEVLGKFGTALVNIEHNPTLMRAYLNICYAWGELYVTLAYYSINGEVVLQKTLDSDSSACNITYLHSYLSRDHWCLISQRIANFGEKPCKLIMNKLYIQKMRAMLLFEEAVGEEVISSIRTSVLSSIDDHWRDTIFDQLVLDQIVAKANSLHHIAEIILKDVVDSKNFKQLNLLFDCQELTSAMIYKILYKLNKALKRKHKRSGRISLSSKIFPSIPENLFSNEGLQQLTEVFVKEIALEAENSDTDLIAAVNEKDLSSYMDILKTIPIVQCDNANIQEVLMIYLMCVLLDLKHTTLQNEELTSKCESIIIGLAQNYCGSFKFLIEPFLTTQTIIEAFSRYIEIFTLIVQNVFKNENDLEYFKGANEFLTRNVGHEKYLQCNIVVLKNIDKYKKSKISAQNKNLLAEYQEEVSKSFTELTKREVEPSQVLCLTEAYALTLKYNLSKKSDEGFTELLPSLNKYVEGIVNCTEKHAQGAVLLFTTILRNKSKLKVDEDIVLKAWSCCRNFSVDEKEHEDYSKLVILIFEHIPNEQFSDIANDLLKFTAQLLRENRHKFAEHLKIWNAILSCNFNPTKMQVWQKILESLLLETVLVYLREEKQENRQSIYEDVVKFELSIIQNVHLLLTAPLIEAVLITVSVMTANPSENFVSTFTSCISLLEMLLKFRKSLIMDYLPTYLQRYRALLSNLCAKSNSDLQLQTHQVQQVSDCAHKLEKLTRTLVSCNRHLMRISPYLIADILKQYEEITLYPNVKIHLNNCLYSLISLCDQHAIAYLMRILSTASTEMFKVVYENYKKYYKFTGKV